MTTEDKKKNKDNLQDRPPIVVILGHVDHGKSSILEAIKDLKITTRESGGITQHIGAYGIEHQEKKITFIDTPGHEAFSAMRSRGAKVADISILVVAADEGVKPQTKEAIQHIKKAGTPFIVAINKIDKPGSDPQKVKGELAKEDVLVETMGGKIPSVNVSAETKEGIEDLLELILIIAEVEELKADYSKDVEGVIVEAHQDPFRGSTATLILINGLLEIGDVIGTSSTFCKIKNLENFQGKKIEKGYPSMPIILFGFDCVPKVGEKFKIFSDIETAKSFIINNKVDLSNEKIEKVDLDKENTEAEETDQQTLNLILKADVLGSLEAIIEVLKNLSTEKVNLKIIKSEVGDVNENDIKLAKSSRSKILSFRVKMNPIAQHLAEREKINVMKFEIIYELVESVRHLVERITKPEIIRKDVGKIKILQVFLRDKNRQVIGGKVVQGEPRKGVSIEILRVKDGEEEKIGEGKIVNLQRNKKDAEKVIKGDECGLLYEGSVKIEEGDIISFYVMEKV